MSNVQPTKYPQATITITPNKIEVHLSNWEGIGMNRLQQVENELLRAHQQHRANGLLKIRQSEAPQIRSELLKVNSQSTKETTNG